VSPGSAEGEGAMAEGIAATYVVAEQGVAASHSGEARATACSAGGGGGGGGGGSGGSVPSCADAAGDAVRPAATDQCGGSMAIPSGAEAKEAAAEKEAGKEAGAAAAEGGRVVAAEANAAAAGGAAK
jgi:hypothetical protein